MLKWHASLVQLASFATKGPQLRQEEGHALQGTSVQSAPARIPKTPAPVGATVPLWAPRTSTHAWLVRRAATASKLQQLPKLAQLAFGALHFQLRRYNRPARLANSVQPLVPRRRTTALCVPWVRIVRGTE